MAAVETRSFETPDERRTPPHAEVSSIKFGSKVFTRITYYPGFHWTTDIKPGAGTDLCMVSHFIYVLSGRCRVAREDGQERDFAPGDLSPLPPGHDAWVIGDEPFVALDMAGAL